MRRVVPVLGLVLVLLAGLASVGGAEVVAGRDVSEVGVVSRVRSAELEVSAAAVKLVGSVVAGSATVANVGGAGARSSTAAVAWRSSAGGGGLVQLGRFKVPALRAGERHKASFRVGVPKGAAGSYEVSVCADVLGQVQAHAKHKSKCRSAGVVTIPASGVKGYGPTGSEPSSPSGSGGSSSPPTGSASSPPGTVIDSGPTGLIGESSVTFTFHGSDTDDTFQCALDGAPWAACTSPQQYPALAEGAHTFQVRAINAAGEVDPTPASASFTVEATPPQTTITSAPHGRIPTGEVSIAFTSSEVGSSFQCSLDGGGYSSCSSPYVIADPAAGPHTFSVLATNQAGVKEAAAAPSASWNSVEAQHDLCGTITSNTTLSPEIATAYVVTCTVTVSSGTTLTVDAGAVVKASGAGIDVDPGGVLDVIGTASSPAVFTSVNDNTVGGSTGSGSPVAGEYAYAIHLESPEAVGGALTSAPSVTVDHAVFRYGSAAISDSQVSGVPSPLYNGLGVLTVENSELESSVVLEGEVSAPVFDDDTFKAGVLIGSEYARKLEGNTYQGDVVAPTMDGDTFDISTESVEALGNTAGWAPDELRLSHADVSGVPLTGPDANHFDGSVTGDRVTLTSDWVPAGGSWEVPASGPAVVVAQLPDGETGDFTVSGTLTVDPGAVVKASGAGIDVDPGGVLDASGTSTSPVTFTSLKDDSVDGDTYGETTSSPVAGEWAGIVVTGSDGALELEQATIRYAATGLTLGGDTVRLAEVAVNNSDLGLEVQSGQVSLRGELSDDISGIRACDWDSQTCSVDAPYSYWGTAAGPFPSGKPALACGAVTTSPYRTSATSSKTETAATAF
ncbi:MAG: hypothetical protein WA197_17865, partial [Candidatus Acidiferrales bacterium]